MLAKFQGADGRTNRIEALLHSNLIRGVRAVAEFIADNGEPVGFSTNSTMITQNDGDDAVYFILCGSADIWVNKRLTAARGPRDAVGEMAAIDPTAPRSATVRVTSDVAAIKLSRAAFIEVLDRQPLIYGNIALVLADRLRERAKHIRPPNEVARMFVASSAEGLPVAREIQLGLKHDDVIVIPWTDGVFGASAIAIESLIAQATECDFAVFVFGPDDKIGSRGERHYAPRDNVVFELGLFMGSIGRERTYIVKEHGTDIKIPSDLSGVTPLTYIDREHASLATQIAPVCTELRRLIDARGVR